MWQPAPIPEEMVAHGQLALRQDPHTFGPPATSDTEYQRQAPAVQMTSTQVEVGSSSHARITVQDDDNLKGDILTLFNEVSTFLP
jgi:E3 ubiquitin-protein ligase DRIP